MYVKEVFLTSPHESVRRSKRMIVVRHVKADPVPPIGDRRLDSNPEGCASGEVWQSLERMVRGKVQEFVQEILEDEFARFLGGRERSQRRESVEGAPRGYRNDAPQLLPGVLLGERYEDGQPVLEPRR